MTTRPPSCPRPCSNRCIGCQSTCDTYRAAKEWHEAKRVAEKQDSQFFGSVSETSWRIKKSMKLKGA